MTNWNKVAVIIVQHSSCICSNCGKETHALQPTHDVISGYGRSGKDPGCGAVFVARTQFGATAEDVSPWIRPELPFVPYELVKAEQPLDDQPVHKARRDPFYSGF